MNLLTTRPPLSRPQTRILLILLQPTPSSLHSVHTSPASPLRLRTRPIRQRPLKDDAGHNIITKMADEKAALLNNAMWDIPKAPWATALPSRRDSSRLLPQAIAHRGYKASWPENTMGAFKGAVEAGAHAVETDVHLSRDGVAVLSHDTTLTRCFGVNKKLGDCDWDYLSTLRTLREPKQGMPRLRDLLEWLVETDEFRDGPPPWILLDIKLDDDPQDIVNAIATSIAQVPSPLPWETRIVLGCWNASVLKASRTSLPNFPIAHIGSSLSYARHFLPLPNIGFNMAFHTLVRPYQGRRFMRDVYDAGRPLFAWTVNHPRWMRWCIERNGPRRGDKMCEGVRVIDGVVTDDPGLYLEVCERYEDEMDGLARRESGSWGQMLGLVVDIVRGHVRHKLFFWYRRYVQGKMDKLDGKTRRQIKKD